MLKTIAAACLAALASAMTSVPAQAAATESLAIWELNEPSRAATMNDTSGNGLHGVIGTEVITGVTYAGATGYRFPRLVPDTPPAHPEHIVRISHDPRLNPADDDFSVEVRYRTTNSFGNLIQKGQSGSRGGYWKIQLPQGEPSCLFRGATGVTNAVRSTFRVDDGQWHVVRCDRTADAAELWIDGVFQGRNRGLTGPIANTKDMYLGGKGECDQITVTCDYFGGDVDYVRVTKGYAPPPPASSPPTAAFTASCDALACVFDGSASDDPDGDIASYAWDFGDGGVGSGATAQHVYAAAATYSARLTVTDRAGLTATTLRQVTTEAPPPPAGDITFRGVAGRTGNLARPSVTLPAETADGDTMVLVLSVNRATTMTDPPGWTVVGSRSGARDELQTRVWRRVATATDGGTQVAVPLGIAAKFAMVVSAYSGVSRTEPFVDVASAAESSLSAAHRTPSVAPGGRLVSFWTDKSSSTSDWSAPPEQEVRAELIGSPSGQVSALLTDGPGGAGGLTATADSVSSKAVTWSLSLNPS